VFWPVLKSNIKGSELAPDGPIVKEDIAPSGAAQTTPQGGVRAGTIQREVRAPFFTEQ
jgi:hypothetical protein